MLDKKMFILVAVAALGYFVDVFDLFLFVSSIQHELNIPVGIGFSLLMNPRLLRSEVWLNLAKIARDILHPASDKLLSIGIE